MAALALLTLYNATVEKKQLIVNYGCGKYCKSLQSSIQCVRKNCTYIHSFSAENSFEVNQLQKAYQSQINTSIKLLITHKVAVKAIIQNSPADSFFPIIKQQLLQYSSQLGANLDYFINVKSQPKAKMVVLAKNKGWSDDEDEYEEPTVATKTDGNEEEFAELQSLMKDYIIEQPSHSPFINKIPLYNSQNSYKFLQNINVRQKLDLSGHLPNPVNDFSPELEVSRSQELNRIQQIFQPQNINEYKQTTHDLQQRIQRKHDKNGSKHLSYQLNFHL